MTDTIKFAYSIIDQANGFTFNTNSAITARRFLGVIEREYTERNDTKAVKAILRQFDGQHRLQAQLKIENGQVISAHFEPEFMEQVEKERREQKETGEDHIH